MNRFSLVLIGVIVAALAGLALYNTAYSEILLPDNQTGVSLIQSDGNFDRESCEQNCRSLYGVDPYFRGGGGFGDRGRFYVYAQCVDSCNNKFWKEFDRRTRDLQKDEE